MDPYGLDRWSPRSLQLIAGRTAQEHNRRKNRRGAFWEDRYHATAIETNNHLHRCIAYIDLNMVRAGKVKHPSQWPFSGYHEIQRPPSRYALIDRQALKNLCGFSDSDGLSLAHQQWIDEGLGSRRHRRGIPTGRKVLPWAARASLNISRESYGNYAIGKS